MANERVILKSGRIVRGGMSEIADVVVRGGMIEQIAPEVEILEGDKVVDCTGKIVVSGLVVLIPMRLFWIFRRFERTCRCR